MKLEDKGRDLVRQGYTISFNTQITFSLLSLFHKTLSLCFIALSVSHWPAIFCYIFLLLCLLDLRVGFLLVVGVWKMGFKAWLLMDPWVWMCVGVLMFVFWLGFWGCILIYLWFVLWWYYLIWFVLVFWVYVLHVYVCFSYLWIVRS